MKSRVKWEKLVINQPTECLLCKEMFYEGEMLWELKNGSPTPRLFICKGCGERFKFKEEEVRV